MGMDVSYHPVDLNLYRERILPFVMGGDSIDDLVTKAVRCAKTRLRANEWGLGVGELDSAILHEQFEVRDQVEAAAPKKQPGFLGKLLGKKPKSDFSARSETTGLPGFESDLLIWGRPFFITMNDYAGVSEAIDQYLAAEDDAAVDSLAQRMLEHFDRQSPAIGDDVLPAMVEIVERIAPKLAGVAKPKVENESPDDATWTKNTRWKLDLFRDCFANVNSDAGVRDADGNVHEPRTLFATDFLLASLEFASTLQPGWMARGNVWPTWLLEQAGIDISGWFEKPTVLVEPLFGELPELADILEPAVIENYMVGGIVMPDRVADLIDVFETRKTELLATPKSENWEDYAELCIGKILEALHDAHRRGFAFAEAAEVYSGPFGMMN